MKLKDVLRDVLVRAMRGDLDVEISAVTSDSRLAVRGSLFVAIPGTRDDGAKYVDNALENPAVDALVGRQLRRIDRVERAPHRTQPIDLLFDRGRREIVPSHRLRRIDLSFASGSLISRVNIQPGK